MGVSVSVNDFPAPEYNVIEVGGVYDGRDNYDHVVQAIGKLAKLGGGVLQLRAGICGVRQKVVPPAGIPIVIRGRGMVASKLRHLTGGRVLEWIGTHVAAEFGCGLEDLTLDGNGSAAESVCLLENGTLFSRRRIVVTNNAVTGLPTATGLELVSMWDSTSYNTYVADCGGGANPAVLLDALATGGFNGNSYNNCQEHDLHIELSGQDCDFCEARGNATNGIDSNKFWGFKAHGNAASGAPFAPHCLLRLSQYAIQNEFFSPIIAYGKGAVGQVVIDGRRNVFYGGTWGVAVAPNNTSWAIQFTANSDSNRIYAPNILTPNAYASVNKPFRSEAGTSNNGVYDLIGNFGSIANPIDEAGRSHCRWVDLNNNLGWKSYASDGITDVFPGQLSRIDFQNVLTDAATIAVDARNGGNNKVTLAGNRTMDAPTNLVAGMYFEFEIIQDGVGGRTLLWHAIYLKTWSDVGNTAGKRCKIVFRYNGSNMVQVGQQGPYV